MKLRHISRLRLLQLRLLVLLFPAVLYSWPQTETPAFTVSGSIGVSNAGSALRHPDAANVVVWLTPLNGPDPNAEALHHAPQKKFILLQKDKTFYPHLLVIPVGSEVQFPNKDPFFHNVFSLFDGKRFDLGLYESGTSRSLRFDRPGVSYLFCNIHSEMSAVIVALDTPYYATSDRSGGIVIPDVPPGRYWLHIWREGVPADTLKTLARQVTISPDSTSLGKLIVPPGSSLALAHKNKYGRDYDNPTPPGQIYGDRP